MNDKALKTKNIFGKSLKRALKRAGFTQGELANDLHIETKTVNSWCNGHTSPKVVQKEEIEKILKVKIGDFPQPVIEDAVYWKGRYDELSKCQEEIKLLINEIKESLLKGLAEIHSHPPDRKESGPLITTPDAGGKPP
jgi:transcriptional regulator with XRE-family HTH domain